MEALGGVHTNKSTTTISMDSFVSFYNFVFGREAENQSKWYSALMMPSMMLCFRRLNAVQL